MHISEGEIMDTKITRMVIISMLFVSMAVIFSFGTSTVAADQYSIYVNPNGNDSWEGQYAT